MSIVEDSQPEPITFKEHIFDFSFHPSNDIVAVGLINGQVQCFNYSIESNQLAWSTQVSKKSCRGVEFTNDGAHLMSISRDKSIQALDVSTGRLLYKIPKAHKYAINKICKLDTYLTATGDDEGIVKIWDMRTCKSIAEFKEHDDFISDMNYCKSSLLVTSGDGLLSIHDTRQLNQKVKLTDEIDDELLSMAIVNDESKVIAGSQSGALYMWDWNNWNTTTKWIGHPSSVDSICKLDENAICTGASDGLLRFISVSPQKFEGVLGDHGQDFPIETVKMNHDNYLASCGHDLQLRFWNIQFLFEQNSRKHDADDHDHWDMPLPKRPRARGLFFEDL